VPVAQRTKENLMDNVHDPIDPNEIPQRTHLASEEQQLLAQLDERAPKSWARFTTLPVMFIMF